MTTSKIIHIDQMELACRITEAMTGLKRPIGKSAYQSLTEGVDGFFKEHALAAADVAMGYIAECIGNDAMLKYTH